MQKYSRKRSGEQPKPAVAVKRQTEETKRLRASHELKEAGDNSLFCDEMQYRLEGLLSKSASVRCDIMHELLPMIADVNIFSRIKALGFASQIFDSLQEYSDNATIAFLLFFCGTVTKDSNGDAAFNEKYYSFLQKCLESDKFVFKSDDSLIKAIDKIVTAKSVFGDISCRSDHLSMYLLSKNADALSSDSNSSTLRKIVDLTYSALAEQSPLLEFCLIVLNSISTRDDILDFITPNLYKDLHCYDAVPRNRLLCCKILVSCTSGKTTILATEDEVQFACDLFKEFERENSELRILALGYLINLIEMDGAQLPLEFANHVTGLYSEIVSEEVVDVQILAAYLALLIALNNDREIVTKLRRSLCTSIEVFMHMNLMVGNNKPEFVKSIVVILEKLKQKSVN